MGFRLLKAINHYAIWQFIILGIALYAGVPYIVDLLHLGLSSEYFGITPPKEFSFIIVAGMLAYIYITFLIEFEKEVIYRDKTGRSYRKDLKQYKRPWKELLTYFKEADKYRIDPETLPKEKWQQADGIILGHIGNRLIKRISDAKGNLTLFALPGGGKTTSQMIPTALRFGGSVLAIDIKGDILAITQKFRKIKVFSPDNAKGSCHFDPLYGMKDMQIKERKIVLEQMATILIPAERETYFSDGGRDFFVGIALYMIKENPNVSFPEIIKAIVRGNGIDWVIKIKDSDCGEAQEYTNAYYGTNEKNVSGAYGSLVKRIRPLSNGDLDVLLTNDGNCISPKALEDGYDVYIIIPQDKIQTYAPLTTIIVQTFMNAFMSRADLATGKKNRPILFLLDEFNELNFDYNTLMSALATLRSKKVTLFMAQQSISQLKNRYGNEGFRGIIDTCGYICLMSAQDPDNRRYFQELIGKRKTLKTSVSKALKNTSRGSQEAEEYIFDLSDFNNLGNKVLIYNEGKYIVAEKCNLNNQEALNL